MLQRCGTIVSRRLKKVRQQQKITCHEEIQDPENEPGYLHRNYWGFLFQTQDIVQAGGKSIPKL